MKTAFIYLISLLCGIAAASAQQLPEKGVPELKSYTPSEYKNSGKIWDIDSASNGIVYMAADKGLLEYDGKNWKIYEGSSGFTRSVNVVSDSLIYTGSDLDFGVWQKNVYQDFEYRSLYPFREDLAEISEEFWEIHRVGENILFVSDFNIYAYRDDALTKIAAPEEFVGSYSLNGDVYFADKSGGLFRMIDLSLEQVANLPAGSDFEITGMYEHDEAIVLVTYNSGLYRYSSGNLAPIDTPLSQELKAATVFSFEPVENNYLAFGTVQKGLFISDLNGNIVHHINRNKGLPNNTILSTHFNVAGQLWLGMDYGISSLKLRDELTFIYDYEGNFGTGYTALLKNGRFYLGTNKGLYQSSWEQLNNNSEAYNFELIPGSEGQVWTLENIRDDLFAGHDRGLFLINDNRLERLSRERGFWTLVPYRDVLLGGTYNGIFAFEKTGGTWSFKKQIELIAGSASQILVEADDIVWVNIPNYGIIRMVMDDTLYPEERSIFLSDTFRGDDPYLVKEGNRITVRTDQFQYAYSAADSTFNEERVPDFTAKPENSLPGIFQPDSLNSQFEFLPLYNGFGLKNTGQDQDTHVVNGEIIFRRFEAFNNEERLELHRGQAVPYRYNNVHITYLIPNREDLLYQYRLGDEGNWSSWSADTELELVDLPYGEHQLFIRAMVNGSPTEAAVFMFEITSPWYFSWYAYVVYVLLLITMGYLIYLWQSVTLKRQEKSLQESQQRSLREQAEKHRREILLMEQERLQTDYDKLEKQLKNKTIELANKAKENQDKNRLLVRLKNKLEAAQQKPEVPASFWNEIHRLLDSYINLEDNTFEIQMDELHQEFFQRLKDRFPDLSSNDLRLCAYLKLGFSSKEIAEFSNIKPSSVYINRSRLRKKLNLDADEDLTDFLNAI
ncbi:helix-turn-helix and ligand-binding sensor domain-containing protein [Rhodohalobacter mucosus]|uniref:HTH luxR-type domain-containing protein n=1 Tax=Rhodohalobacter mucosus TaxID=2079485 RepID=A0A316TTC5_9BACT|nr:hypothetical protein [Rhodohalobacter mucosus]PWN06225.1 hypothetical protein DDZ15_10365 [Rhodohalobacter mucosus]